MTINNLFATSDLGLVATISLYYPIDSIDRSNPHKIVFYFKRESDLDGFVENYWRNLLTINPITFFNQLKIIKARIYEG